jgi:thiol-disulfide isomerase/thioredoxin
MKVLKIGAEWCPGCIIMKPRWAEIEKERPWLESEYFDYDESPGIVEEYGLEEAVLPTFIFLDKVGEEFLRLTGEKSKKELLEVVEENKER